MSDDTWLEEQQRAHNLASFARPLRVRRRPRFAPAGMDLFTALRIAEAVEAKKKAGKA